MNLNQNPQLSELQKLYATCQDRNFHHVVWVDRRGNVYASAIDPNGGRLNDRLNSQCRFRFETYIRGNDYVGADAAADKNYMQNEFSDLINLWKANFEGYYDGGVLW